MWGSSTSIAASGERIRRPDDASATRPIELSRLYSHQEYIGKGVGQNLMDHPSIYGWGLAPAPVGAVVQRLSGEPI